MGEIVKLVSSSDSVAKYVGDTIKVDVTRFSNGTAEVVIWDKSNGLSATVEKISVSKFIKAQNILPIWLQKTSCDLVEGIESHSIVKSVPQAVKWCKRKSHKGPDPDAVYCRYHREMRT